MKPQSRKLLFEGILILVLFVLIAVSFTVAWFKGETQTNVNEFVIEVKSSDNFQLSLDGVNFQSSITINLDNKAMQVGDKTMDSSVQLSDLASILTSLTNEQGTATYNQLSMYAPVKDEDTGEPITTLPEGHTWEAAVKSKVTKSGDQYYLSSSSISSLAQYLELDIWVRSDSNLSIYLGSDSTIYPVTEVDEDADFTPAMSSKTITEYGYTIDRYYDGTNSKNYGTTYTSDGYTYVFRSVYNGDEETSEFLFKTKVQQVENPNTHNLESFTFYYNEDDIYIARSKVENISLYIDGTTTALGQCEAFYGASNSVLFYVKKTTDGHLTSKTVYDSQRKLINASDYATFFESYGSNFIEYMNLYAYDSHDFTHTTQTHVKKVDTYYYNELGELLIRINKEGSDTTYYNKHNEEVEAPEKPYKVLKESYYGTEDKEEVGGVFTTKSTKYTFSKNLAAGAALVSFSEMVTDEFASGVNTTEQREVENLKYLWNPLPEMSLETQGTTSKYVYNSEREEVLSYYTYDSETNKYTLNNWNNDNELIKIGDFTTTAETVGTGESPILETKVSSGDKYAVKKMRVKIWLDGNDTMATNSMLNSSTIGNGQVKMCINLVANINATSITYEPYVIDIGGVPTTVPGKFLLTASKANGKNTTYSFSVSGTWVNTYGYTLAVATLEDVPGRSDQKIVSFYKYGSVTVYARDGDGRIGQVNVSYDYAKLIKIYDEATPNSYKIIAVSPNCTKSVDEITASDYLTSGTWEINNLNIASTVVNADGSLTVNFNTAGEEIITYSCEMIETLNNTEYYATSSIKINHTYVVEGGE